MYYSTSCTLFTINTLNISLHTFLYPLVFACHKNLINILFVLSSKINFNMKMIFCYRFFKKNRTFKTVCTLTARSFGPKSMVHNYV